MFIVLSVEGCLPHINIEVDKDGNNLCFDTEKEAYIYASENCAWDYKVIEW